ncbi:MAG: ROK family protein [Lachnospiraceae bacterium]|nr:ROK family protein [Lachnospiraceae bacterium]
MILGVDIGGTNIKFGIIDENYNIVARRSIPTATQHGAQAIVEDIIKMALELQKEYPLTAIGIGTPGTVDYANGICVRCANIPYQNTPMTGPVQEATGLPVKLANDASCAICGELYAGNGREYQNLVMITLGTGVGGGIIIDGKPYFGTRGGAGEFGHMVIDASGRPCRCGQKGCLEQYASVTALIRETQLAAEQNPDSVLAQFCKEEVNGQSVFDAVKAGCPVAKQVLDSYLNYLAVGVTSLTRIFQPDVVVLGGAVTNQEDALVQPLREKIKLPVKVVISQLKNDAGIIGAAAMAVEQ